MSINVISADLVGAGNQYTATSGETVILAEDTMIVSTGGSGIYADGTVNNMNVVVAGSVYTYGNAINLRSDGITGDHSITVLDTGSIVAEFFTGLLIEGENAIATNYGQITTSRSAGMYLNSSTNGSLINFGTVTATSPDSFSTAMTVTFDVDVAHLENHGTLVGNSVIEGTVDIQSSGSVYFLNTGTVTSLSAAYMSSSSANDTVVNTGLIQGDVNLGTGVDLFAGPGGTVNGRLLAGGGNDDIRISGSDDWVHGGAGTDVLYTDGDAMALYQIETVRLLGTEGVAVGGDATATTYYGSLGNDVVAAGDGADIIHGRGGNDELHGDLGDDTIRGGAGDDEIHGGEGLDRLIGDADADVYVFASTSEMSAGAVGDRIELH